jgi:hypothetical protein
VLTEGGGQQREAGGGALQHAGQVNCHAGL